MRRCPKCNRANLTQDGPLEWCQSCAWQTPESATVIAAIPQKDIDEAVAEAASPDPWGTSRKRRDWVQRRKERGAITHGSAWSYFLGCHCDPCRNAHLEKVRAYRAKRKAMGIT